MTLREMRLAFVSLLSASASTSASFSSRPARLCLPFQTACYITLASSALPSLFSLTLSRLPPSHTTSAFFSPSRAVVDAFRVNVVHSRHPIRAPVVNIGR